MNSLLLTTLVFLLCVWLCPTLITGRKVKEPKVKCYQVYKKQGNSCKKRDKMPGRYTRKDCCQVSGGAAYQTGLRRGKKKCIPCSTAENWSAWGTWDKCNSPCGPGISRRTRQCLDIKNIGCPGSRSEKKKCVNSVRPNCPVHGGWSDWSDWSACSPSCGADGQKLRSRSCTNPKPQYGGRVCLGVREENQKCEDLPPCPIDGGWGEWGPWSGCDVKCGLGFRHRKRACDNPKPQHGGKPCDPIDGKDKQSCKSICDDYSGSGGSGDSSGYSGDDSSGSGDTKSVEAMDEERDDDEGSAKATGSGGDMPTSRSDFDFSEPTRITTVAAT